MELLNHVVREDWRELTREMRQENLRLWRGLQGLVGLSTLLAVPLALVGPPQPWRIVSHTVVSSCLFIGFSLWAMLRRERGSHAYGAAAATLLAGTAVVGGYLRPEGGAGQHITASVLAVAGGVAMVSSWLMLAWARGRRRQGAERLGVAADDWAANALMGGVIGGALGIHLILAAHFGGLEPRPRPGWPLIVWYALFLLGLRCMGEELLFRGLGFHLLRDGLDRSIWATAVPLTLLNLLTYVGAGYVISNNTVGLWPLPYVATVGALNVALRDWRRSLVPGLVCNVCFHLVVLVALGYTI